MGGGEGSLPKLVPPAGDRSSTEGCFRLHSLAQRACGKHTNGFLESAI